MSLCKSSLNFYISIILSRHLSIYEFSPLCSEERAEFYFISAYRYNKLLSKSPWAFLNVFSWTFSLFASYLFLLIPFYKSLLTWFKSDSDLFIYFYSLFVFYFKSSLYFCSYYNFLFVLLTSYYLDLRP